MQEPPNENPRPSVPPWAWIAMIFLVIVFIQLWINGTFSGGNALTLSQFVETVQAGNVSKITVNDNKLTITTEADGQEVTQNVIVPPETDVYALFEFHGITSEQLDGIQFESKDNSARNTIATFLFTFAPILLLIWIFTRGFRQIQGGGNNIFGFGRSRAKNLSDTERPTVTFDDVAGVDEAKEEVQEVVQFLREPEKFIQVGARIPKGVLMVGPPGTGKTLLARAIAGEAGVPFFHISGSEFVEMFVGVGASRVRDLFNKAKEHAPAIVFVDEIDAVGRQRGAGLGGGNDEREQTLNQILVEMDGFSNETNLIVIAATNRPDVLDPALMRPGRFDRKVTVDRPDLRGRQAILKVHSRGKPVAKNVDLEDIARLTAGFTGADLENLMNEAAIFTARRGKSEITGLEFQDAFDRIVIGPERKSRILRSQDKEIFAYHEAGHAIVTYYLPHTDPVQKITIIPRGPAGGFVMTLPQDRATYSRSYFHDQIAFGLGGRAAEEIFFGEITTGASNDLEQATNMARAMIMRYGMSEELGLRIYGEQSGNPFLGAEMGLSRNYSEEAAKTIDKEVRRIIDENYTRAKQIITDNRDKMEKLAQMLIEVETLDRSEFEQLMEEEEAPPTPELSL
ncbi:MAG TPA: ATP-dependent zinc metalloprotease FtsH [Anaerolineae bacterium]|nr:ATP-dependent zinc metalloprotease FtsH [Anaerolineae bacterium]